VLEVVTRDEFVDDLPPALLRPISGLQIGGRLHNHFHHVYPLDLVIFEHQRSFFFLLGILEFTEDNTDEEIEEQERADEDENDKEVSVLWAGKKFGTYALTLDVHCLIHVIWPILHGGDRKQSEHGLGDRVIVELLNKPGSSMLQALIFSMMNELIDTAVVEFSSE
jgi:hypothetical protein